MIELLERLSIVSTVVPGFGNSGEHDAVFGFLAWPYLDSAKAMAEVASASGDAMPPEAAAAVAALIAEEQVMRGPFGFPGSASSAYISGAEALRALKLREMAGAEGAIAGSTTTAARRRAKERRETGRRAEDSPETAADAQAAHNDPVVITPAVVPAAAVATAAPQRHAERIAVRCPECHASNSPGNRACIACGERMPAPA